MAPYTTTRAKVSVFGRYTAASVVAACLSELAFLASYGLGMIPLVASLIAWFAGAVPNYLLNRRWAWQRDGKVDRKRELLPYVAIVVVTAGTAAVVTTVTDALVRDWVESHTWQVLLVGAAYLGTYGVMFLLKFLLFDKYVFTTRPDA